MTRICQYGAVCHEQVFGAEYSQLGVDNAFIGARSHVWGIEIRDADEKLVCISRLTIAVIEWRR